MKKLICALAASWLMIGVPAAASAQTTPAATPPGDVLGTWDVNFTTDQGPIPGYLKLKKDGARLVGTVGSQMGETSVEAEVKGKDISVWFDFRGQNGTIPIVMSGTVNADRITGTFTAAGQPGGEWVATRAKETKETKESKDTKDTKEPAAPSAAAGKIDLTGDWALSVELPNMTATPALTLKQDGETLTGDYVSTQYGKFPLKGTVKGADVTFTFTMSVEGTGMEVTYTGTVDKDGNMAGAVNYGDMMSGRFTASKKR